MPLIRKFRVEWLLHAGILATFALIPLWLRLPQSPIFARLYVTRFLILLPMLWSITFWLIARAPGLRDLLRSRWRVLWAWAILLLVLWANASQIWAFRRIDYPEVAQTSALQFGISVLFAIVVMCAAPSPRAVIGVLVISLIGNATITVIQAQNQAALGIKPLGEFPFSAQTMGASILEGEGLRWVRPYGLMPHPNLLAGSLVVGVLAAAAWIIMDRRRQRITGIIIFALGLWALLLSFSRAAWGGLLVGVLAIVPFLRSHLRRPDIRLSLAAAFGVALVIGLAFLIAYRPLLAARAGQVEAGVEMRSVSDRIVFINLALRSISERPIFGVGIGNFPWRTSYYLAETDFDLLGDNVHNVLLSAAAELGIIGLLLLIAAIICGVIAAVGSLRNAQGDDRAARLALFAVFVALFAVGLLDHYPWTQIHFQVAWWGCLAACVK